MTVGCTIGDDVSLNVAGNFVGSDVVGSFVGFDFVGLSVDGVDFGIVDGVALGN